MATIHLLPAADEPIDTNIELVGSTDISVVDLPSTTDISTTVVDTGTVITIPSDPGAPTNIDVLASDEVIALPSQNLPTDLNALSDVDSTAVGDGAVLVYKDSTKKWTATLHLEQQYMHGGFF